jgi:Ca2+-transporting ATPase
MDLMDARRVTTGNVVLFKGLTPELVEESRRLHGANVFTPPPRTPWWREFLEKFDDPIIRILMVAAAIAIAVGVVDGSYVEGIGIVCAILLATFLAFLNEHQAAREFDLLNQSSDEVPVKVVRAGLITTVPIRDLVVGDIVLVEMGEEIPADGDLLEAVGLQISESRLTGESVAVHKATADAPTTGTEDLAYPRHRLLRGTTVEDGHGVMRVIAVGDHTEIGQTARAAAVVHDTETPLNRQLARLAKLIGVVAFGVAGTLFAALVVRGAVVGDVVMTTTQWMVMGLLALGCAVAILPVWLPIGYDALELLGRRAERPAWLEAGPLKLWLICFGAAGVVAAIGLGALWAAGVAGDNPLALVPAAEAKKYLRYFMVAVTVIVVAVPEGLAMSVTLSLAYSMRRMTATNNLVRRMHACETIGATTVICSDKTGTLTRNEMNVVDVELPGLDPETLRGQADALSATAYLLAEAAAVNGTANLSRPEDAPATALGNPTEGALLLWLENRGIDYLAVREPFAVTAQLTFSPVRKFMATLGVSPREPGRTALHVKGAPEVVLGQCTHLLGADGPKPLDELTRNAIEAKLATYQERAMRALGFGHRIVDAAEPHDDLEALSTGLTWLGFVAIADPVRDDVAEAVRVCRRAGIDVKMVTGDNSRTATEIARQIGLLDGVDATAAHLTGPELAALDDDTALARVRGLRIMSRARPADKLRLVSLLQRTGSVVAVTGDGTNDAPALNLANVGLAMGKSGTSVAKEASDIILLDDSFTSITNAAMWGRSLYQNIQRFVVFQLTINVCALLIVLLGPFIGIELPLTVSQMLWVNLIMDTFAALALAAEPPHASVMDRPPRDPEQFILTRPMVLNVVGTGLAFFAVLVGLLVYFQRGGLTNRELTVFFTIFVMLQFWNLFNARTLGRNTSALVGLGQNRGLWMVIVAILVGQLLIVQYGGRLFRTEPLTAIEWLQITAATSIVLWIGEAVRAVRRMRAAAA